ncbi:MAG: ABC transporter permease [Stenotrophomonas sp.]
MRMNQEVDAMQVMGVNPFQALVIPRVASLLLMLPLLTFMGMIGGLVRRSGRVLELAESRSVLLLPASGRGSAPWPSI